MDLINNKDAWKYIPCSGNFDSSYLISCTYDEYCQGYDQTWGYFLVTAPSFEDACFKLKKKLINPYNFQDHTIK